MYHYDSAIIRVAGWLKHHADDLGEVVVSDRAAAEMCELTVRTYRDAIRRLRRLGAIEMDAAPVGRPAAGKVRPGRSLRLRLGDRFWQLLSVTAEMEPVVQRVERRTRVTGGGRP